MCQCDINAYIQDLYMREKSLFKACVCVCVCVCVGGGVKPHRRHCVVVIEQDAFILA